MSSPIVVFSGPTLGHAEASRILDAVYLPPVCQGDVYKAYTEYSPIAIGIIDGYFENVPSVWHKEILFAMAQGVHVFGAASTGALRAAELASFGMVGVGQVFEWFTQGALEDDDEVAVLHGPDHLGYPMLSEAMVNIRQTVRDALQASIITEDVAASLLRVAKELNYKDRTHENILEVCSFPSEASRRQFSEWLREGRRNIKKEDALQLLREMRHFIRKKTKPKEVRWKFEDTMYWRESLARLAGEKL